MSFKLQKLTRWKRSEDRKAVLVGAVSPMCAVNEVFSKLQPTGSIITAIYRLWNDDREVHHFWESGNSSPVAVDVLVGVINYVGFMIVADFGHKVMPVALKLSKDEPLTLSESFTKFPWIKSVDLSEYEMALNDINLSDLWKCCLREVSEPNNRCPG